MMTFSPRVAAVLMLMIGFLAVWNTIIPAMVMEWILAGGWRCGCGEFNPDSSWLCGKCGRAR